mgnify:CR=1 FL=1
MNWETFSQILSHDDCNTKIGQIWLAGILQITKTSKLKITPKMTDHRTVGRNLIQQVSLRSSDFNKTFQSYIREIVIHSQQL